ncbi:MAG: hypothetical protein QOH25_1538 [Acidobacteriota bacterium]|jgi:hypothetical protein|nr:hypothetical protein [Acidobacteriota bacterium]
MCKTTSQSLLRLLVFCASLLVIPLTVLGQSPFSSVKMEVTLNQEGAEWKAEAKFTAQGQEFANPVRDLKVSDNNNISFTVNIGGADVRFVGKLGDDKLGGTLEAFERNAKIANGTWGLTRQKESSPAKGLTGKWSGTFAAQIIGEQASDPNFDTHVARPAYVKNHPRVLFDEAHNNFHTTTGRYKPFADLIANDGYQVTANTEKFSKQTLEGYDVLVISNALGPRGQRNTAAFTDEECDAVRDWVRAGGALLFIADHAPMGAAAEILSKRFGVDMSKGYTGDPANNDKQSKELTQLVFSRENKLLGEHAITSGRNAGERINRVITFTGQSLRGPEGSVAILRLADTAVDKLPGVEKEVSAAGRSQGVALKLGKGRVVVLAEAAMLTAQVSGEGEKFGMNVPGNDDRQLALNIMHWLSGLLK